MQRPHPAWPRGVGLLLEPRKSVFRQVRPSAWGLRRTAPPQYVWIVSPCASKLQTGCLQSRSKDSAKSGFFRLLDARIQPEGHLSSVEPAGALASQWAAKRPRRFFSRRLVLAVSSVARHSPERDEGCSYRGVSRPSFPSRSNTAWVTTESKAARRPRTSRKPAWFLMPGKGLEPLRLQRRHLILSQARMTSFATPAAQG